MDSTYNFNLAKPNTHIMHLCQAKIEMIVLAIDVLNDPIVNRKLLLDRPPLSNKARNAIRGYMFQLIKEIKNV